MDPDKDLNKNFMDKEKLAQKKEFMKVRKAKHNMFGAWFFTIPIIIWAVIKQFVGIVWPGEIVFNLGITILTLPPLFHFGKKTFQSAFKSLSKFNLNMDLLIAIGSGIAFLTGPATFFTEIGNYTDVAATIIAFHLTGQYFKEKAKGMIARDIEELIEFRVEKAKVIEKKGIEMNKDIAVTELKPGDIILVNSDQIIPVDGQIVKGKIKVDESMLNGRTSLIEKTVGDKVIGGAINKKGLIKIKVNRAGKNSYLSQLIKKIEKSENCKYPIQKYVDRVIQILIPMVLITAALTFLIWILFPDTLHSLGSWAHRYLPWVNPAIDSVSLGIMSAIAVLVVACPCALGLAIPTAMLEGIRIGEENDILIQDGQKINYLQNIGVIVFDLTEDITQKQFQLEELLKVGKELKRLGIKITIISKDNSKNKSVFSIKNAIDDSEMMVLVENESNNKLAEIKKLKDRFGSVAYLGANNINSQITSQIDVDIAINKNDNLAVNNSDFLLLDGELSSVITAVKLSKNIYQKIKGNIFWAIIYNIVAIPVAMLAFLHPVIAELVMAGSSMSVVANARSLKNSNIEVDYQHNEFQK